MTETEVSLRILDIAERVRRLDIRVQFLDAKMKWASSCHPLREQWSERMTELFWEMWHLTEEARDLLASEAGGKP